MANEEPKIMVISLYQPYASLMALGAKCFETRTWGTKFTGQVIIHASKTLEYDWRDARFVQAMKEAGIDNPAKLPLGAALAVGDLVGCYKAETVYPAIGETERLFGNYAAGRVAWKFTNMKLFLQPVPIRGQQYLWEWKQPLPELAVPF
jgi:hypothetical protein